MGVPGWPGIGGIMWPDLGASSGIGGIFFPCRVGHDHSSASGLEMDIKDLRGLADGDLT